jgi:hypothetical protein
MEVTFDPGELITKIKALSIKPTDTVIITTSEASSLGDPNMQQIADAIVKSSGAAFVLFVRNGESVTTISEETMNAMGWVRAKQ